MSALEIPHQTATGAIFFARASMYKRIASSREGIGAIPSDSDFAFDSAEYFGRCAGVRYSRSLVANNWGWNPANSKMIRAN